MSLLLDALKRAEQEKLARHGDRPDEAPAGTGATPASGLELQPLGPAGASARPSAAQAAQVVFQAKSATAANEPNRGRGMILGTAVGAILVVVIAAGAYVWHTIRTLTPEAPIAFRPRPAAAAVTPPGIAAPREPLPGFSPPRDAPAVAATGTPAASAPAPEPAPPAQARPAQPARLAVAEAPPGQTSAPAAQALVGEVLRQAQAQPQPEPLRLERSAEAARVPRELAAGYDALVRGELAPARRSYEAALAADGPSVDAHLGLATVEAQSGNRAAAARHYRQALELDPRNATALAGLAALADHSRPEVLEARLREDLSRQPDSAPLRFALGNLYASQRRWNEAQAEFFEAYRLDPAVADVLYNLAVSLDHLGQPRLAAEFYRRALDASRTQATQFDPAPVARRLAELRP